MINPKHQGKSTLDVTKRNRRPGRWPKIPAAFWVLASIMLVVRMVLAQSTPQPVLAITSTTTNQMVITITNNIGMLDYDLQWTPVLGSTNFPWTFAAVGIPGGTNFILAADSYPTTFFRAILDTNAVPLWEAANPNNPASAILNVIIASPANGSVLQ